MWGTDCEFCGLRNVLAARVYVSTPHLFWALLLSWEGEFDGDKDNSRETAPVRHK